jgi:hypothetical protein
VIIDIKSQGWGEGAYLSHNIEEGDVVLAGAVLLHLMRRGVCVCVYIYI